MVASAVLLMTAVFLGVGGTAADARSTCTTQCITITLDGDTQHQVLVSRDDLTGWSDLSGASYALYNSSNATAPGRALTVRALLMHALPAVAAPSIHFVAFSVAVPGYKSLLAPSGLDAPADPGYPYGARTPPAVWLDEGGSVSYARPQVSLGDNNFDDYLGFAPSLQLEVHTQATLLSPTLTADPSGKIAPNTSVTLSAQISNPPNTALTYDWTFDVNVFARTVDDPTSPPHRYTRSDYKYGAQVTVSGADGSYGRSDVLLVQTKPELRPDPTPTPTPTPTSTTPRSHASSPGAGRPGGGNTSSTAPTLGPSSAAGSSVGAAPTTSGEREPTTPVGSPTSSTVGAPSTGSSNVASTRAKPAPASTARSSTASPVDVGGGQRVAGILLGGGPANAPAPSSSPSRSTGVDDVPGRQAGTEGGSTGLGTWVIYLGVGIALLAVGIASERRRPTTVRRPPAGR